MTYQKSHVSLLFWYFLKDLMLYHIHTKFHSQCFTVSGFMKTQAKPQLVSVKEAYKRPRNMKENLPAALDKSIKTLTNVAKKSIPVVADALNPPP